MLRAKLEKKQKKTIKKNNIITTLSRNEISYLMIQSQVNN